MVENIALQRQEPKMAPQLSEVDSVLNAAEQDAFSTPQLGALDTAEQDAFGVQGPAPTKTTLHGSAQYWDYVKAKYTLNDTGIKRGWLGTQVMAQGGQGYEEALKLSPSEEDAVATVEEFRQQNDLDNHMILNFLAEAGAGIPGVVPYMVEMAKGGLAGAAVGGAMGAAGTAGVGAVPLGILGARLGSAAAVGQILQGNTYLEMRRKGIAHDKANAVSIISGSVQGSLSVAQLGTMGKATGEAAKAALGSWSNMASQFMTQQLKAIPHIGLAAAQQAAVSTVNHIGEGVAAILDSKPEASPLSLESAVEEYAKAFLQSLAPFTGVIAAGKTLGFGASATGRLLALSAARATRQVKARANALQERVFELEKQFDAEGEQGLERDLIDEINAEIQIASGKTVVTREVHAEMLPLKSKIGSRVERVQADIAELNKRLADLKGNESEEASAERKGIRSLLQEKRFQKADAELDELMAQSTEAEEKLMVEQRKQRVLADFRNEVLKSKIADISEQLKGTENQVSTLEESLASQRLTGKLALREQARLDKLRDSLEEIHLSLQGFLSLQEFFDRHGSIQAAEATVLDKTIVELRSSKVQSLMQQSVAEFTNIAKSATKMATKEAALVQRVLADLVRASGIKNSDKFASKIRKFKSLSDLHERLPRLEIEIAKEVEIRQYKEALQAVKTAVDFEPIRDGASRFSKHISEDFDEPTLEVFNAYKEFVGDESKAESKRQGLAQQSIDAYQKAIERHEDVLPYEMRARVASEVLGLTDKTSSELQALAARVERIKSEGLDAANKERVKQRAVIEAVRQIALEDIQAGKPLPTDITQMEPARLNRMYEDIAGGHLPSAIAGNLFSWNGLMRWASIFSNDPSRFLALMDVHRPVQNVSSAVRETTTRYHEFLEKHSPDGTFGGAVSLIQKGTKVERIGEYAKHPDWIEQHQASSQVESPLNLSPNQAVKVLMQLKDRKADSSRRLGNGYTLKGEVEIGRSTEELLTDYFSRPDRQAYLKLANGLREFYDQNFQRLSDAIWDEYGVKVERNSEYSGYLAHDGDAWSSDSDFASNWNKHVSLAMKPSRAGMTIERQTTARSMAVKDAFTEVYQQIALFEHWNVWRRAHVPLSAVFSHQPIRNVIKAKFGDSFLKAIDVFRRDLVWGPQIKSEGFVGAMNVWLKQYADVVLLARPGQFVKQVTGVFNALKLMDEKSFSEGFMDFFKDPAKNWARLSRREYFRNRFSSIMNQHIGALVNQGFENQKMATMKEYAGIFVKYGDQVSSVITAHIAYKNAVRQGKTEAAALLEAEKLVNETQSSGTMNELSNMARNPALRPFTLLSQQPTRRLEDIAIDVLRAVKHPTAENKLQARRTIVSASVSSIAFAGAGLTMTLMNPFTSDSQKKGAWESFAFSVLDPILSAGGGIGAGARYGLMYALNKTFGTSLSLYDLQSPVEKSFKENAELAGDAVAFLQDPSLTTFAKLSRDYLFGPNILIPGKPIIPVPKVLQGAFGGSKVPASGLPLLELQNLLEGTARQADK